MNKKIKIIDTEPTSAEENMEFDENLLKQLDRESKPILHFYSWKGDCITHGHFIKPEKFLNLEAIKKFNIDIAKRPTGGGIVFHSYDLAFGLLIPATHHLFSKDTLKNYATVNNILIKAITTILDEKPKFFDNHMNSKEARCNFCMATPTKYDVMINDKKIGGAAQRQTKLGFLHQGTIAILKPPKEYLQKILLPNRGILDAISNNSYNILNQSKFNNIEQMRYALKKTIIKELKVKEFLKC